MFLFYVRLLLIRVYHKIYSWRKGGVGMTDDPMLVISIEGLTNCVREANQTAGFVSAM